MSETMTKHEGKRIKAAHLTDEALIIDFDDGARLRFSDEGQSCCESRYMTCGDDLASFAGARFVGWEVLDAPSIDEEYDVHDVQFLHVRTDAGTIVCETHNRHNGYYGGFSVYAREVQP